MKNTDALEELVSDLIDIAEGYNPNRLWLGRGLCHFVHQCVTSRGVRSRIKKYMVEWPVGTGCAMFPVPHPYMQEALAYSDSLLYKGEYGDNRRALAGYIALRLIEDYDL